MQKIEREVLAQVVAPYLVDITSPKESLIQLNHLSLVNKWFTDVFMDSCVVHPLLEPCVQRLEQVLNNVVLMRGDAKHNDFMRFVTSVLVRYGRTESSTFEEKRSRLIAKTRRGLRSVGANGDRETMIRIHREVVLLHRQLDVILNKFLSVYWRMGVTKLEMVDQRLDRVNGRIRSPLSVVVFGSSRIGKTEFQNTLVYHNKMHHNIQAISTRWEDITHSLSLTNVDVCVICYNRNIRSSFEEIKWRWVPTVRCVRGPTITIVIAALSTSPLGELSISEEEGRSLAKELTAAQFIQCEFDTESSIECLVRIEAAFIAQQKTQSCVVS